MISRTKKIKCNDLSFCHSCKERLITFLTIVSITSEGNPSLLFIYGAIITSTFVVLLESENYFPLCHSHESGNPGVKNTECKFLFLQE